MAALSSTTALVNYSEPFTRPLIFDKKRPDDISIDVIVDEHLPRYKFVANSKNMKLNVFLSREMPEILRQVVENITRLQQESIFTCETPVHVFVRDAGYLIYSSGNRIKRFTTHMTLTERSEIYVIVASLVNSTYLSKVEPKLSAQLQAFNPEFQFFQAGLYEHGYWSWCGHPSSDDASITFIVNEHLPPYKFVANSNNMKTDLFLNREIPEFLSQIEQNTSIKHESSFSNGMPIHVFVKDAGYLMYSCCIGPSKGFSKGKEIEIYHYRKRIANHITPTKKSEIYIIATSLINSIYLSTIVEPNLYAQLQFFNPNAQFFHTGLHEYNHWTWSGPTYCETISPLHSYFEHHTRPYISPSQEALPRLQVIANQFSIWNFDMKMKFIRRFAQSLISFGFPESDLRAIEHRVTYRARSTAPYKIVTNKTTSRNLFKIYDNVFQTISSYLNLLDNYNLQRVSRLIQYRINSVLEVTRGRRSFWELILEATKLRQFDEGAERNVISYFNDVYYKILPLIDRMQRAKDSKNWEVLYKLGVRLQEIIRIFDSNEKYSIARSEISMRQGDDVDAFTKKLYTTRAVVEKDLNLTLSENIKLLQLSKKGTWQKKINKLCPELIDFGTTIFEAIAQLIQRTAAPIRFEISGPSIIDFQLPYCHKYTTMKKIYALTEQALKKQGVKYVSFGLYKQCLKDFKNNRWVPEFKNLLLPDGKTALYHQFITSGKLYCRII